MKKLFNNAVLFIGLAIFFSSLTGCSDSAISKNGPGDSQPQPSASQPANSVLTDNNTNGEKKPSEFPPLASAVSQSELKNADGTSFKVTDKKGKVLLLNMWATWCGPCRSEMPALVKMQDAHREQGFEVIGLNTDDESADEMNAFAEQMNLNYTLVWADTKLQRSLLNISRFSGIPQSFIIDREGNLRGVFRGANPADIKKMEDLVAKVVSE
jgi:thiol-disulfide isomerase/thioredoxin